MGKDRNYFKATPCKDEDFMYICKNKQREQQQMENYIVSARKYRPSTFDTVVGQKALTTTLKNAIATQ